MQNSILTETQREFLETAEGEREEKYTKQQRSYHAQNIRERVRAGILDFEVLMSHLGEEERRRIFTWQSDREFEYQFGVSSALAFLYLSQHEQGMDFAGVLKQGIRDAWRTLESSNLTVDVDLSVRIHEPEYRNISALLEKVSEHGLDGLTDEELATLLRYADSDELSIDLDALTDRRDREESISNMPPRSGWKSKTLGDDEGMSPSMPPEVYRSEGIEDMTPEERRELFPEGPYSPRACYDGEKVFVPRAPGKEPEILHYTNTNTEE